MKVVTLGQSLTAPSRSVTVTDECVVHYTSDRQSGADVFNRQPLVKRTITTLAHYGSWTPAEELLITSSFTGLRLAGPAPHRSCRRSLACILAPIILPVTFHLAKLIHTPIILACICHLFTCIPQSFSLPPLTSAHATSPYRLPPISFHDHSHIMQAKASSHVTQSHPYRRTELVPRLLSLA